MEKQKLEKLEKAVDAADADYVRAKANYNNAKKELEEYEKSIGLCTIKNLEELKKAVEEYKIEELEDAVAAADAAYVKEKRDAWADPYARNAFLFVDNAKYILGKAKESLEDYKKDTIVRRKKLEELERAVIEDCRSKDENLEELEKSVEDAVDACVKTKAKVKSAYFFTFASAYKKNMAAIDVLEKAEKALEDYKKDNIVRHKKLEELKKALEEYKSEMGL